MRCPSRHASKSPYGFYEGARRPAVLFPRRRSSTSTLRRGGPRRHIAARRQGEARPRDGSDRGLPLGRRSINVRVWYNMNARVWYMMLANIHPRRFEGRELLESAHFPPICDCSQASISEALRPRICVRGAPCDLQMLPDIHFSTSEAKDLREGCALRVADAPRLPFLAVRGQESA